MIIIQAEPCKLNRHSSIEFADANLDVWSVNIDSNSIDERNGALEEFANPVGLTRHGRITD
jgi:hypothetical protein